MKDFRNKGREEDRSPLAEQVVNDGQSEILGLVKRAADGDFEAFGKLYIFHVEKIYRYIFYHVRDKPLSEDITEEVFLKAWRAIGSCRGKEKTFSSWLYRIAHNHLVDELRRRQRYSSVEIETVEVITDTGREVERVLEQQELLEVINYLPPNQRQIIILKFIEGLDNHEIASIMSRSEGAIRILQMRALATLR